MAVKLEVWQAVKVEVVVKVEVGTLECSRSWCMAGRSGKLICSGSNSRSWCIAGRSNNIT